MAVTPINITRVSNNMRTISLLDSLRKNTLDLFLEQNRVASGNKLNAPSEDPALSSKVMRLTEMLERQDQILANIRHADGYLSATDNSIGEINDLLIQARDIALEMVNSTADQSERDSMAELIKGITNQLVTVGNRMYNGVYLFGGQQTTSVPFTQDNGGVEYRGDIGALLTDVDDRQDSPFNLTGAELFGALSGRVSGFVDLNPAVTEDTRLADLKGVTGNGIRLGRFQISLPAQEKMFVVDLSEADTIGDVLDMIKAAASGAGLTVGEGRQFNVGINATGNGLQIEFTGGAISIGEVGNGITARDFGILGDGDTSIMGGSLDAKVTGRTTISSLFGGASAQLNSLLITNGLLSATIDLSNALTVQDIINKINTAGVDVRAEINEDGTGIDIVNISSGTELHVGEVGSNTAEVLGIRSFHGQTLLSELNYGKGVRIEEGLDDFRIIAKNGSFVDINLDGATTIQNVIDAINAAAADSGVAITASLVATGNGISIVDGTSGEGLLQITRLNYSAAIDDLGLNKTAGDTEATELIGNVTNGTRPDSVFTCLIDLYNALKRGDVADITDAGERIGDFIEHANRLQGMIGARSKAMQTRLQYTEDAVLATQKLLSETKDLDYTEAVTRFQQAQTTLQANLMTGSRLLELSLMDFLS